MEVAALQADEVMVRLVHVGVVADRTGTRIDWDHLAHGDQLVERVVHGRETHFRQLGPSLLEHSVRGEVHVIALERLSDHPALRRDPPAAHA